MHGQLDSQQWAVAALGAALKPTVWIPVPIGDELAEDALVTKYQLEDRRMSKGVPPSLALPPPTQARAEIVRSTGRGVVSIVLNPALLTYIYTRDVQLLREASLF